jgi:outer membrane receptor protein involved in Fe transport
VQYRFTRSELQRRFPAIDRSVLSGLDREADLHEAQAFALFNHPSGFFARWESHYYYQDNSHLPGESFFQHHIFGGYRFARRRVEVTAGVMNLTDQDYRLNPLTPYAEMPRERVFVGRVKFQF